MTSGISNIVCPSDSPIIPAHLLADSSKPIKTDISINDFKNKEFFSLSSENVQINLVELFVFYEPVLCFRQA